MRALKSLVIFMGILIAIGITVVGVTIYRRATAPAPADKPIAGSPAAPSAPASATRRSDQALPGFAARELDLPAGSTIVSVQPLESRVLVHARLPDGATRILLLDPVSGAVAGEWRVGGGAAKP
jgi:hypothetical protein